jgi:sulfotransferase family protein
MVKIIGAGFGRTGTASLKAALEHLGFGPCYHMLGVIEQPDRMHAWDRALDGEISDWESVLGGFNSTVDWPGCTFWRELLDAYPDAKVVLTVRDPERWYESTYDTIYQLNPDAQSDVNEDHDLAVKVWPTVNRIIWDGTFGGRFEDREHAIDVFEKHNAEVRRVVPADRLLVFQVSEGWQPLCDFLGVPVPAEEFPKVNSRTSLRDLVGQAYTEGQV